MAEFIEVMKQVRRICASEKECKKCLMWNSQGAFCRMDVMQYRDDAGTEQIVMDWAAAHPEPVYPNWKEWQEKTFPNHRIAICQAIFGEECPNPADIRSCTECRMQPISAAIAEKLGIRPKEIDE